MTLSLTVCLALAVACTGGEADREAQSLTSPLTRLDPPAGPGAMAPNLTAAAGGPILTWLEPVAAEERRFRLLLSRLEDERWSAPREVAADTSDRGDGFFANWADLPGLAEGVDGTLVAHWLQKLGDGTYAYGVELARSEDGGASWRRLGLLHDDASAAEHGFVSYAPGPADSGIHAFWLDGRSMGTGHGEGEGEGHGGGGAMELRTALLGDGPAPPSTLLDRRTCECCSTDAAMTAAGPIVVYRDRSEGEVRDVAVVRATADGWSAPRTLHADGWQIHGCPVNGPAVAAAGERVAVAWFTAPGGEPRVLVAFSADAGASFGAPVVVDGERPLGRVDVALDDGGHALVSWLGSAGEPEGRTPGTPDRAEIRLRRVSPAGEAGPVRPIAATTRKRSAGVPRMVRDGGRLVFVWVEDVEPSRLRASLLPLAP